MNTSQTNTAPKSEYTPVIHELNLTEITGQTYESIDLSLIHELNPLRYPFLLESVAKSTPIPGSDAKLGQHDVLFAFPQETISLKDPTKMDEFVSQAQQAFSDDMVANQIDSDLPFTGGWFAYFSYDYAQVVEPVLNLPKSEFPLASLTRVPAAVISDHQDGKFFIICEPEFAELIPQIEQDIKTALQEQKSVESQPVQITKVTEEPEQKYLDGVEAIKEYILAGDVFQVNLSRLWQVELAENTNYLSVYRALRKSNPAPFAALAHFVEESSDNNWQIMSSSPERLVKYQAPWVDTRPIAGTRKRGATSEADRALVKELIEHPKERAEHIMLIDLERNDLGRICQPGTVEVNDLMVVESYEHVHHIVSNVRGQLREGFSPLDIVHALFPGGTITGCPKVRCMEIVAELEQMPREAYTGSLGYINRDGSLDLNILIRTMIQSQIDDRPVVQFRAGAGIVADSQADFELVETRHKAKGLINAFAEVE